MLMEQKCLELHQEGQIQVPDPWFYGFVGVFLSPDMTLAGPLTLCRIFFWDKDDLT